MFFGVFMLDDLRSEIDKIDEKIVDLIAKRIDVVKKIGDFKEKNNIAVVDKKRFDEVLENISKQAKNKGISSDFVRDIYHKIHSYMCDIEAKKNGNIEEQKCFVRKDLSALKPYPAPVFDNDWLLLNSNENLFLDDNKNDEKINYYPHNCLVLKNRMAKFYGCNEDEITITNGSESAIDVIVRTFCEKDEKVLVCSPTFVVYQHCATCNGVDFVDVPLLKNDNQLDVENILKIAEKDKIKVAFIPTPTAPLGNSINQDDIYKLIEKMPNTIFVIDEAYTEFTENKTFVEEVNKYKNVIVLRTLSKFFGMAGLRVGFVISNTENINAINVVKPVYPLSRLSINKILEIFNDKNKLNEILANREKIKQEIHRTIEEVRKLPCVEKVFDSDTNFYFVIFKDIQKVLDILNEAKIAIHNASRQIANGARITIGTKEQNDKLIKALKKV